MRLMRVLHLVKTNVGATWALRLMRELAKLDVDVCVAIPPGGPLNDEYKKAGIFVHQENFDLPIRQPWHWPGLSARFRNLVETIKPDIIHSHFVGTTLAMRLALGKKHIQALKDICSGIEIVG